MPKPLKDSDGGEWLSLGECERRFGVTRHMIGRGIEQRLITTRLIPGSWRRVLASDVERLVDGGTRPSRGAAS